MALRIQDNEEQVSRFFYEITGEELADSRTFLDPQRNLVYYELRRSRVCTTTQPVGETR